ncbi:MAG: hypothetical protein JO205_05990 [Pseudolabrys sp.]|nr:hypothetical protein [Pseudolabrys sp.]MBV9260905.1 hypothetical protein [Pseudolabrys sp.]
MRRTQLILLATLVAAAPILAGCESFDLDKLDIFNLNEKKKLPGERRSVFPEGVPGVAQGVPPELMKGYQPPPDQAVQPEPSPDQKAAEAENPKAKPVVKRKPMLPPPSSGQQQ